MSADAVNELLRLYGIERAYRDGLGRDRVAPDESVVTVLRALGAPLDHLSEAPNALREARQRRLRQVVAPAVVVDGGAPAVVLQLEREPTELHGWVVIDGALPSRAADHRVDATTQMLGHEEHEGETRVRVRVMLARALPPGRHALELDVDGARVETRLLVAPERAHRWADHRRWGLFLPLYAAHSARTRLPDFTHLAELARWSRTRGASALGTLPLFATFLDSPFDPSPYAPVSRRFLNELYLDIADQGRDAPNDTWLDYRAAYAAKVPAIQAEADRWFAQRSPAEITRHAATRPDTADYARFRSELAHADRPPADGPMRPEVTTTDCADPVFRFHFYAQIEADRQLARVADDGGGLYLDFPLGVHYRGYDAWRHRDRFLHGVSAGAPPDPLFSEGQVWGFSPLHPEGALTDGLDYVASCLERVMEHAHVLRIDHVMGLHRIFCVPPGMSATEGVYVQQPADPLYALLLEQSVRTETELVGEDLGTVPDHVRERMRQHDLLRMYVLPFETRTEGDGYVIDPPADALACIDTHDMAPFASLVEGRDLDLLAELGLGSQDWHDGARWQRRRAMEVLAWRLGVPLEPATLLEGAIDLLGASASPIVLINLEDLWLETIPQNVPGTSDERPNWRKRARYGVDELESVEAITRLLDRLVAARQRAPG